MVFRSAWVELRSRVGGSADAGAAVTGVVVREIAL